MAHALYMLDNLVFALCYTYIGSLVCILFISRTPGLLFNGYRGLFSRELKQPEHEVNHLPSF